MFKLHFETEAKVIIELLVDVRKGTMKEKEKNEKRKGEKER